MKMALRRVDLSTDVYFVCLNHAMCTEGEEIVGLLVGEVDEDMVAHVVAVLILRRSDKRKDRVEISPEQLSNASTEAERLACIMKRPVRVVGWYHSHPKLTVYPSLVDVCTQESYQLMDEAFIGMIFSVFNSDPNKFGGRIQMICYQSQSHIIDCNIEKSHIEIPIQLVPSSVISNVCMDSVVQLPRFLCQEEQLAYQMANQVPLDYLTRLHNSSVYLRKMGQIAEVICGPLLKMLEERILNNEIKRKRLLEKKKALAVIVEQTKSEHEKKEKLKSLQKQLEMALKEQAKAIQNLDSGCEEQDSKIRDINETIKLQNENEDLKVETPSESQIKTLKPSIQLKDQEVPHCKGAETYIGVDQVEVDMQEWQAMLNEQEWQSSLHLLTNEEIAQLKNYKTVSVTKETYEPGRKIPPAEIPKESIKTKQQHSSDGKQSKKQKVQEILDELALIKSSGSQDILTQAEIFDRADVNLIKKEQNIEQNIPCAKVMTPVQANEVLSSSQISDSSKVSDNIPVETSKSVPNVLNSPLSPEQIDIKQVEKSNSDCENDALVCNPTFVVTSDPAKNIAPKPNADLNLSLSSMGSKIYIEPISPPDVHSSTSMSPS